MKISDIAEKKAKKINEILSLALDQIEEAQKECEAFESHFSYEESGILCEKIDSTLEMAINELEEIKKIQNRSAYWEWEQNYYAVY